MWKVLFLTAALVVSASPLDARELPRKGDRVEKREELRRDVERISREIYPQKQQRPQRQRRR
jgi:hypothetical protein